MHSQSNTARRPTCGWDREALLKGGGGGGERGLTTPRGNCNVGKDRQIPIFLHLGIDSDIGVDETNQSHYSLGNKRSSRVDL
jgi:hypothetical protein